VLAEFELAVAVEFVLLAMLETFEEAVAVGGFGGEESVRVGIFGGPAGDQVDVAIIAGELEEGVEALARDVGGGEVDGVITFADVEGTTIDGDGFDGGRNQKIGIGIAVAVSVGGEIVGKKKIAYLEKLGDGFAVIAGYTGSEILRSFDTAGSGFDGKPGDGNGSTGAAGIGVEDLIANDDGLRWIGGERRRRGGNNSDGLEDGGELCELEGEGFLFVGGESKIGGDGEEGRRVRGEMVGGRCEIGEKEMTLGVGGGFGDARGGSGELEMGIGNRRGFGIEERAGELGLRNGNEGCEQEEEKNVERALGLGEHGRKIIRGEGGNAVERGIGG